MNKNQLILVVLFIGNYLFAADKIPVNDHSSADDFSKLEIDFDLDFLREKEIKKSLFQLIDMGWRFIGYDSYSYQEAKKLLKDNTFRLELILAILAVEKYPTQTMPRKAFKKLLGQITMGNFCEDNEVLKKFVHVGTSTRFATVFETIRMLTSKERMAIAENLVNRIPFLAISEEDIRLTAGELKSVSNCLHGRLSILLEE